MKNFIDFDKNENVFYDNLWLDDQKIAIKIPISKKKGVDKEISVEKFDLTKFIYIMTY